MDEKDRQEMNVDSNYHRQKIKQSLQLMINHIDDDIHKGIEPKISIVFVISMFRIMLPFLSFLMKDLLTDDKTYTDEIIIFELNS